MYPSTYVLSTTTYYLNLSAIYIIASIQNLEGPQILYSNWSTITTHYYQIKQIHRRPGCKKRLSLSWAYRVASALVIQ